LFSQDLDVSKDVGSYSVFKDLVWLVSFDQGSGFSRIGLGFFPKKEEVDRYWIFVFGFSGIWIIS
jgi:hypothetical protein